MNKKTAIVSVLLGVLLIGIISAGVVGYLSNMVSGSVVVEGPVFYATGDNDLLINEFDGSTSWYNIIDSDDEKFWTQDLDETLDFYKPKLDMYVRAKVVDGILPKDLKLVFSYYSGDDVIEICDSLVSVTNSGDPFVQYSTSCEGDSTLLDVDGFVYKIIGLGTQEVKVRISVSYGETKVEMDKAT